MEKRQILDIGEHLIPDNSLAETAALVTLPDGSRDIVEIFGGTGSNDGFLFDYRTPMMTYEFRTDPHTEGSLNTGDLTLDTACMVDSFDTGEDALFPLSEVTSLSDFGDRMDLYAINCLLGVVQPIHAVDV